MKQEGSLRLTAMPQTASKQVCEVIRRSENGESPEYASLVSRLKMGEYRQKKLTLQDVLNIGQETMNSIELRTVEDIPWYFLQNVMASNVNARNTTLKQSGPRARKRESQSSFLCFTEDPEMDTSDSVHPLDVLCVLVNNFDSFLQQEIVTKMSMCQFAVPLLLPTGDGSNCTFMLWAMRDIVKRWRPHSLADSKGFMEDSIVKIPMPTFSFVRLGTCNLSKSKFLNHLLSPAHTHFNIFVNNEMDGGNYPRNVSDGLVEISWFFPGGTGNSETFPEPFAVSNLHGDLKYNLAQFTFLTQISATVFIFIESFTEKDYRLFTKLRDTGTNYYFIFSSNNDKQKMRISGENLKQLSLKMNVFMIKTDDKNVIKSVKDIQEIISDCNKYEDNKLSLEDMANLAKNNGIRVDEDSVECQEARKHALLITSKIKDVAQYKKDTMRLQGDLWIEISMIQKEMCRMTNQGKCNSTTYRNQLTNKYFELTRMQYQHQMPDGIKNFLKAITLLRETEKKYFIKWLKFYLDMMARKNVFVFQDKHKKNINILDNSLGIEHFLREMGQFYEAECTMIKHEHISPDQRQFSKLPGIAADLLLDGFPLELIDGDASNIPLQWITDVLTELDTKTGGRCRMRVISVLGIQSTGKSTLLNTMFGLQFPVASGRCTRGAFMSLIKVKENVQKELDCDFILVIDTEGLKAPELYSLENSFEHDNELATLVVGLSDITIINMAMENMAEMKDTLQIVVHAFLRMSEVGKKPNCHLVHQNVSDVTAYVNNELSRRKLLKELNDVTHIAAKMEKINRHIDFSDIIDYDPEKHSWYFPGLWNGGPPMALVNPGYSENVCNLKKHLIRFMKGSESPRPQNISSFIEWVRSLAKAVKHETFIFSFRNILVAEGYNQLSVMYSELEWNFRKQVYSHLARYENKIKKQLPENLQNVTSDIVENKIKQLLDKEETNMTQKLELFFKSGCVNVHLVERYREDFFNHVKSLRKDLEVMASSKCWETVRIQNGKGEIQNMGKKCRQLIKSKLNEHLASHKMNKDMFNEAELERTFNEIWGNILQEINMSEFQVQTRQIGVEMLEQLKQEMRNKPGAVTEKLNNVKSLKDYGQKSFEVTRNYIYVGLFKSVKEFFTNSCLKKLNQHARTLTADCQDYVKGKVTTKEDYSEIYCQELLTRINDKLDKEEVRNLHYTPLFVVDLKLHILGTAVPFFQKIHDNFRENNNQEHLFLELKSQYLSKFKDLLQCKEDTSKQAKQFCNECLKPAIIDHMYKSVGNEIVDDVLTSSDAMRFKSQMHFQFSLLKELLEINQFENYLQYITQYENYVRNWISTYIANNYANTKSLDNLLSQILSSIAQTVRAALRDQKVQNSQSLSGFLETFFNALEQHLVLSRNAMKVSSSHNTLHIYEFCTEIENFLSKIRDEIGYEMLLLNFESFPSFITWRPQDELFKTIIGCGKKCPFCNAPCEAGGTQHSQHLASVHRPVGFAEHMWSESNILCNTICSNDVLSNDFFMNSDTNGEWHPYKDYRTIYPDWIIQPDRDMSSSTYWKFVFVQFGDRFAQYYKAIPAEIPWEWKKITKEQALLSLHKIFKFK
ncbi:up-regulator of cell proliferation-like [Pelobates cultripes]|uniref:Up-regulator of cell proliferation-like n=1 Tax=Pelobates cultripes TaxID=61616 RepID=A0AAD1SRC6_PELCU|nr:up-regulator of cell proliferation-like [Pelobates cultripes]